MTDTNPPTTLARPQGSEPDTRAAQVHLLHVLALLIGPAILLTIVLTYADRHEGGHAEEISSDHIDPLYAMFAASISYVLTQLFPLIVMWLTYRISRARNRPIAFHALQGCYFQLLFNLITWVFSGLVMLLLFAPEILMKFSNSLSYQSATLLLLNVFIVLYASCRTWFNPNFQYPFVGRLARAATLGLPTKQS
ncbi:MAG: hypothetical protein HY286_16675 [Planctomycetes bacterium]|nr:hypothetical protein [Planctomycetota bacterium]